MLDELSTMSKCLDKLTLEKINEQDSQTSEQLLQVVVVVVVVV